MSKVRIEAPNVCPNGETGHLIKIGGGGGGGGGGVLECLNCKVENGDSE